MSELWVDHVSFSQLTTASECPYAYYLQKVAGVDPVENAFAQGGNLAHKLLADWAKGIIPIKELPVQWSERFPKEVTAEFPRYLAAKGYAGKLFDNVLNYFEHFDGFPGYKVIGAEQAFQSSIAGVSFKGVVDLILRSEETGGLMIVDHKSCSASSFKKNREKMYKQLLLYGKHCADTFGEFPERLRFNLFKENLYDERPFDRESYIAARLWAESVIQEMKDKDVLDWFETRPEYFRCVNLCNCRNECFFGNPENHKRKEDANGNKRTPAVA